MPYAKSYLALFIVLQLFCTRISAQIWPGDINDNGEVNAVDVLYWALSDGTDGIPRANSSFLWTEQPAPSDWPENFPDGQNFSFADCNGDGEIDLVDLIVIQLNQDSSRSPYLGEDFSSGVKGTDPEIWLGQIGQQHISSVVGSEISIPINIGSAANPVSDFFGIAFQIQIDTTFIGEISPIIEQGEGNWLENESGIVLLNLDQPLQEPGRLGKEVAFYLFDPAASTDGFGNIGNLSFIIEDDLTLLGQDTTITITIEPIRMINSELVTQDVVGDTLEIILYQDSLSMLLSNNNTEATSIAKDLNLYPNPSQQYIYMDAADHTVETVQIFDAMNRLVFQQQIDHNQDTHLLSVEQLPPGVYWLRASTTQKVKLQSTFIKLDF